MGQIEAVLKMFVYCTQKAGHGSCILVVLSLAERPPSAVRIPLPNIIAISLNISILEIIPVFSRNFRVISTNYV